jgi:hypothetical protein
VVAITYADARGKSTALYPTRPKLAASVHINGPWPHLVKALTASLEAAHEVLVELDMPRSGTVDPDDISIEVIDRIADLGRQDRYLLRLTLGILCRREAARNGD